MNDYSKLQKELVRERIVNCATEEFLLSGYSGASMRNISKKAGMTVGNIYAYFSNKEELLDFIVQPVWRGTLHIIDTEMEASKVQAEPSIGQITDDITHLFTKYRPQFMILLTGSEGSKYADFKDQLISYISKRIDEEYLRTIHPERENLLLATAFAAAFLEGALRIFKESYGDETTMRDTMRELLSLMLSGMCAVCRDNDRKED